MTEDEAKQRWCPMVRMPWKNIGETVAANRTPDGDVADGSTCIGSACMMFRKLTTMIPLTDHTVGAIESCYCGLAGKP